MGRPKVKIRTHKCFRYGDMSPSTGDEGGPLVPDHRATAERVLHPASQAYVFGGAVCQSTLQFAEAALVLRVPQEVGKVNSSVSPDQ